jgi:hypothetical protein
LESMRQEAEQRLEEAEQRLEVARSELTAGHQLALATLRQDFQQEHQQQLSRLEFKQNSCALFFTVLRIHDNLVWIRIRGSMPLTDPDSDSDPDPAIFVIDLQDGNQKLRNFFKKVFCLLLFEGAFTSFFKDKCQKEVTKHTDPTDPDPQLCFF